jgi:hypothetical protein
MTIQNIYYGPLYLFESVATQYLNYSCNICRLADESKCFLEEIFYIFENTEPRFISNRNLQNIIFQKTFVYR